MNNIKKACGAIFISLKTNKVLFNLRSPNKSYKLCWSLWGGMFEEGETTKECLLREIKEEMGSIPRIKKIYPFDIYESNDKKFRYYSFVCIVDDEFIPVLNKESAGYAWLDLGCWPTPMHEGAKITLCNNASLDKLKTIISQF